MNDIDPLATGGDPKDRNFITALARGLDILRCFQANELALSNTDFAERTGLPKPTVSRLTYTLCRLEYLIADPGTGMYRLGPGVLLLGYGVLAGMDIADRAAAEMKALCKGPNSYITCALGEKHRSDVVYIAVHRSLEDVSLTMQVGARLPLFFSAIGRAILVGMQPDDREAAFAVARDEDPKGDTGRRRSFEKAHGEYEQHGYCTGYGDWRDDVNGIAVPILNGGGARVYGLNVGGPSFHVPAEELEGWYAERIVAAAQSLSIAR